MAVASSVDLGQNDCEGENVPTYEAVEEEDGVQRVVAHPGQPSEPSLLERPKGSERSIHPRH